jgi:hypothetical protein
MNSTVDEKAVVSELTLALLEDSGMYRADYSKAMNWSWGKNAGCHFQKRVLNQGQNAIVSGRLEVYRDGYCWGTVCDDNFGEAEARIACQEMG